MRGLVTLVLVLGIVGLPPYGEGPANAEPTPAPSLVPTTPRVPPRSLSPGDTQDVREIDVDLLLARAVGAGSQDAYDLTADFKGSLTVTVHGAPFTALASGSYRETRKPGELRRRQIKVHQIEVPLLLRPFTGSVRNLIEKKTEMQSDNPATFNGHDIFVLEEQVGPRYVLAGVHRRIVDEAIDRYGGAIHREDPAFRRNIARWLYTAPTMRGWIVRAGPPYALRTVVDEPGLIYELQLFYDWGQLGTKISYVTVQGKPAWRDVTTDTTSELSGLGRVDGQMILSFSNHCLNCPP